MFVPAGSLDVVPGVGLVAEMALLHARGHLTGDGFRDHFEVPHIVAWRRLMTLRAILGAR